MQESKFFEGFSRTLSTLLFYGVAGAVMYLTYREFTGKDSLGILLPVLYLIVIWTQQQSIATGFRLRRIETQLANLQKGALEATIIETRPTLEEGEKKDNANPYHSPLT